jgi:hypothetical protein
MNNHFNLGRFGLLFRKHTTEHIKTYLMSWAVLTGSLLLVIGWIAYMEKTPFGLNPQQIFFAVFLMGAGTIFTSTVFSNLSGKNRAIATLMLPASQLEKFLVGWLYSFVLFLLVFTPTYFLTVAVVISLDSGTGEVYNIFEDGKFGPAMLLIYSMLHGVAIWGAVAFEKLSFIKTAFGFFIVILLVVVLNNYALERFFGRELGNAIPFSQVGFPENNNYYSIRLDEDQHDLMRSFPIAVAGLLWLAALVRLREKQV